MNDIPIVMQSHTHTQVRINYGVNIYYDTEKVCLVHSMSKPKNSAHKLFEINNEETNIDFFKYCSIVRTHSFER